MMQNLPMEKIGYVYIMTNTHRTTLYVGVTSKLIQRTHQHKQHIFKNSFTDRYNLEYLVYYEWFSSIEDAISAEKVVKKLSRKLKEELITSMNTGWRDLWNDINGL